MSYSNLVAMQAATNLPEQCCAKCVQHFSSKRQQKIISILQCKKKLHEVNTAAACTQRSTGIACAAYGSSITKSRNTYRRDASKSQNYNSSEQGLWAQVELHTKCCAIGVHFETLRGKCSVIKNAKTNSCCCVARSTYHKYSIEDEVVPYGCIDAVPNCEVPRICIFLVKR